MLTAGNHLLPKRMLAELLSVDLSTIARAYGEARRRGLILGDGRRGSFVRRATVEPVSCTANPPMRG